MFGWHGWALRLPGLLAVPALGVAIAVLVRRFAGRAAAVAAVCLLCLNATFLDLASQLKPYAIETLAVVAVVLLWLGPVPGGRDERARGTRRTAAGIVALCAVPAVFVVVPLAALDVLTGAGKRRRRLAEGLPAVGLVTAHACLPRAPVRAARRRLLGHPVPRRTRPVGSPGLRRRPALADRHRIPAGDRQVRPESPAGVRRAAAPAALAACSGDSRLRLGRGGGAAPPPGRPAGPGGGRGRRASHARGERRPVLAVRSDQDEPVPRTAASPGRAGRR
ncbi:glycosyltransferase family 39 protein [Parafrankia elaeagni]|uniref:glycosyltransferase family 39 protein n=1 Tax=Parafrankia elaeagni TaxID=222534 RepID=UPI002DDC6C10|nr:glycosyltransferase family 39 protein [Parafrankia elaeagni]